jgi:hypothetical protein
MAKKMHQKTKNHQKLVIKAKIGGIQQRAQKIAISNERGWHLRHRIIAT